MDLQCPIDPTSFSTPLHWRRIDGELLVSGEIDESSSRRFAEALASFGGPSPTIGSIATAERPATTGGSPGPAPWTGTEPGSGDGAPWLVDLRSTRLLAAAGVTILIRWLRSLENGDDPPPRVRILPSASVGWVLEMCRLSDTVWFCDVDTDLPADTAVA